MGALVSAFEKGTSVPTPLILYFLSDLEVVEAEQTSTRILKQSRFIDRTDNKQVRFEFVIFAIQEILKVLPAIMK